MAGLDDHENGDGKQDAFEDMVETYRCPGAGVDQGRDPFHQEPGGKEVEALEGVESDVLIVFEFSGGEDDDRGDPPDCRDIAEDGGSTR